MVLYAMLLWVSALFFLNIDQVSDAPAVRTVWVYVVDAFTITAAALLARLLMRLLLIEPKPTKNLVEPD